MEYISKPREVKNPIYKGICQYCGREFVANKPFAKYCCTLCRSKARRARFTNSEQQKTLSFDSLAELKEYALRSGIISDARDIQLRGSKKKIPSGVRIREKYDNNKHIIELIILD